MKGLFQATLRPFLARHALGSQVVLHADADLYSSTLYVLTQCNDVLHPGSVVIFDEFASVLDEFRALEDYCAAYMRDYEVIAVTRTPIDYFAHVAVQMR